MSHADHHGPERSDPRPLRGYETVMGTYALLSSGAIAALAARRGRLRRFDLRTLAQLTLATQHLSRLIAKDSVVAPLRAPFTEFEGAAGEGEVNERAVGSGVRHAIGELLTCPFCLAQWIATGLVASSIAFPEFTESVTTVCSLARLSDYLQIFYDRIKQR